MQTTKTGVHGAINMLGLAKRVKGKIFQASTSEVYGDPDVHPQSESYWGRVNPIGVRSCYDEGKRCAETLFFDYLRQHRLRIKVGRIFNTYGPGMPITGGASLCSLPRASDSNPFRHRCPSRTRSRGGSVRRSRISTRTMKHSSSDR